MLLLLSIILFTAISASDVQPDIDPALQRRAEKVLEKEFDKSSFSYTALASDEHKKLYLLESDGKQLGLIVFASSKGRFERFTYLVVYNFEIEVQKVKILAYHSTHGTGVTSRRWLRQFEGNSGETLRYGHDIQAISGATYSATSLTEDIPALSQWVKEQLAQ